MTEICLGNKTNNSDSKIYKTLLDMYEQMKQRIESSIPYISGTCKNGYTYEMMKFNSLELFTLGYKANCCFRLLDIGYNHLLHAALCRNGRILIIRDYNGEFKAFIPLKRNGEVLIANSIECEGRKTDNKAINAFSEIVKEIVRATNSEEEPIKLVCIGNEAYAKPNGVAFPTKIETPTIYEKDDSIYGNTDSYHKKLDILYKDKDLNLNKIKYGNPNVSYKDPRSNIRKCDFLTSSREDKESAIKVINCVRYTNANIDELENFTNTKGFGIVNCIYNDDWYLLLFRDGYIYGDYINYDERAKVEFDIAYDSLLKELNKTKEDCKIKKLSM